MLPTITIGGQPFYDMSGIVGPDVAPRVATDEILFHHSVGQSDFSDQNHNGTTMDEEVAHIKAINAGHVARFGPVGFGYQAAAFRSGRVYVVGRALGQRAHIYRLNHRYAGIVAMGDYSTQAVPYGIVLGTARFVWAMRIVLATPNLNVSGHRQRALPESPTSCPGNQGIWAIQAVLQAAAALARGQDELLKRETISRIKQALQPTLDQGDLETLAKQMAWLTGGKLCA